MSRTPLALLGSIVVILSTGGAFMVTAVTGVGCEGANASDPVCTSDSARLSLDVALAVVVGSAIVVLERDVDLAVLIVVVVEPPDLVGAVV